MFVKVLKYILILMLICVLFFMPDCLVIGEYSVFSKNILFFLCAVLFLCFWKTGLNKKIYNKINSLDRSEDNSEIKKVVIEDFESSFNVYVYWVVGIIILVVLAYQLANQKVEALGVVLIILSSLSLYSIFYNQVYNLPLKDVKKDKEFWLSLWNSLYYSKKIVDGIENKKYVKIWDVRFNNRDSITIEDVRIIRNTLSGLSDEEIEEIMYTKNTPTYYSEFFRAIKTFFRIINIATVLYIIKLLVEFIKSSNIKINIQMSEIIKLFTEINLDLLFYQILMGILIITLIVVIIMWYNFINCTQKKNQVKKLLEKLLLDEYRKRGLKYVINDDRRENEYKYFKKFPLSLFTKNK